MLGKSSVTLTNFLSVAMYIINPAATAAASATATAPGLAAPADGLTAGWGNAATPRLGMRLPEDHGAVELTTTRRESRASPCSSVPAHVYIHRAGFRLKTKAV